MHAAVMVNVNFFVPSVFVSVLVMTYRTANRCLQSCPHSAKSGQEQ